MIDVRGGIDYMKLMQIIKTSIGLGLKLFELDPKSFAFGGEINDIRWFQGYLYVPVFKTPTTVYRVDPDSLRVEEAWRDEKGRGIAFWNYFSGVPGNWWSSNKVPWYLRLLGGDGTRGYLLVYDGGKWSLYETDDGVPTGQLVFGNYIYVGFGTKLYRYRYWANPIEDLAFVTDLGKEYSLGYDPVNDQLVAVAVDGSGYRTSTDGVTWSAETALSGITEILKTMWAVGATVWYHEPTVWGALKNSKFKIGTAFINARGIFLWTGAEWEHILPFENPIAQTLVRVFSEQWWAGPKLGVFGWGAHPNDGYPGYLALWDFHENTLKLFKLPFGVTAIEFVNDEVWLGESWKISLTQKYFIHRLSLWEFREEFLEGKPHPISGYFRRKGTDLSPWKDLTISANETTSRVPAFGYDRKYIYFEADTAGTLTIEVDVAGDGNWRTYDEVSVAAGGRVHYILTGEIKWVRLKYDTVAKVTAMYHFR